MSKFASIQTDKQMKKYILTTLVLFFFIITECFSQSEFTTCLFDSVRNRPIPIAVYQPQKVNKHTKVVVFNHGYDGNEKPAANQSYTYLTRFLSEKGYYVISIQHELSDDPLLAMEGDFMETRMPNWKRGMENILFVINEYKKLRPELDWKHLSVIGHSNGGDMTMLLATEYPRLIKKAISMDHRRMVMPRVSAPQIYTLRGCDYDADPRVVPTTEEQQKHNITVIKLDGITHSDMGSRGTKEQYATITKYICKFIKE